VASERRRRSEHQRLSDNRLTAGSEGFGHPQVKWTRVVGDIRAGSKEQSTSPPPPLGGARFHEIARAAGAKKTFRKLDRGGPIRALFRKPHISLAYLQG
jgi:hypothetical protein